MYDHSDNLESSFFYMLKCSPSSSECSWSIGRSPGLGFRTSADPLSFEATGLKYKYSVKWCLLTFQHICLVCNMYDACHGAATVAGLWLGSHHSSGAHNPEQCIHVIHGHMYRQNTRTHKINKYFLQVTPLWSCIPITVYFYLYSQNDHFLSFICNLSPF